MGHAHIGGKALLYLIDGLYAGHVLGPTPTRLNAPPFYGDWSSSLFVSQDPVAIDSVAFDFLRTEPGWTDPHMSGTDDYLHEAAQADNPPSGTFYDPDHSGDVTRLASLGVHEHWNNSDDKQYSRNLGTGDGIELYVLLSDVVCQDPVPPCEGGEAYNPTTGLCEELPDAPLSTECEADGDLCTTDYCDGQGSCVNLDSVICPGQTGECEAGEECNPTTGLCEQVPNAPLSTPCEADGDACTIDQCDGAGSCVVDGDSCGDGTLQEGCGEQCDDGNNTDGDGCSATCQFEVEARPQDKDQQKCIVELNKNFEKVAKAQARHLTACIKDGSKGKLSGANPIETCIAAEDAKVNQAKQKLESKVNARCAAKTPDFGVILTSSVPPEVDTDRASEVAGEKELALIRAIFGSDLDAVVDAESPNSQAEGVCRVEVIKQATKCQGTKLKEFTKCKKKGLGGALPFGRAHDLEDCMGADRKGKIRAACLTKLGEKIDQQCSGLNYTALFAGDCSGEATLDDFELCIDRLVECQVCLALNEADALNRNCDGFDDGAVNGSCP
jgi:cysteine-rich repeat protein